MIPLVVCASRCWTSVELAKADMLGLNSPVSKRFVVVNQLKSS